MRHPLKVWRDTANRLSPLRIAALALLIAPAAKAIYDFEAIVYGARPLDNLVHRTGFWAIIFLLVALSITPLRRIARFPLLADVRRMIGVGAFVYAAAHILLFVADLSFNLKRVATEIIFRVYLTIGFIALFGLTALAATSTDGMVRRLGVKRWQRLHQAIYVIAGLALIHFFQQNKADVSVPTFAAGLFGLMIGYRVLVALRKRREEPPTWMLLALAVGMSALTFICEAIGLGIVYNVSPWRVLQTSLDIDYDMIAPGWQVLAVGLVVVLVDFVRARFAKPRSSADLDRRRLAAGKQASRIPSTG
ncbi:MAG TPA: protein-methionine-sulfoxide reductase heme-binding subunit MsrQ [Xanthobacteraceae bacterium]|nr:protein-methionine-sulfoxide reductase heme-binding subunit MsrQ [Xanthobacteraceae bacterium]